MTGVSLDDLKSLLRTGAVARARSVLADIDDLAPDGAERWYLRSLASQQMGDLEDAWASARRALALSGDRPYFRVQAARVAAQRGKHLEAIAEFEAALRTDAKLALAWAGLGASCLEAGRSDAALQALRQAVSLGATSAPVLFNLARLELAEDRLQEALDLARQAASATIASTS